MGAVAELLERGDELASGDRLSHEIRGFCRRSLAPQVEAIDRGHYPEEIMRGLGQIGAFLPHLPSAEREPDLAATIAGMAAVSETCVSTGFMYWCQATFAWYVANSENEALKRRFLDGAASARRLGGTGLSNPMKSLFGIERMRLKGKRVEGGYVVRGSLPWVSNLGPDHAFGTMFECADDPTRKVMFIAECDAPGVTLTPCAPFLAMDGTGTYAVAFRDVFVPDDAILADPADDFVRRIRGGFILLQTGMAIGVVRDSIAVMNEVAPSLGHVNAYLPDQPETIRLELEHLENEVAELARTPYDQSTSYFRRVVSARLLAGELSVKAAHNAMLHAGARGYVMTSRVQRRLREAYFVAIVTPATKQLRKMLADLDRPLKEPA